MLAEVAALSRATWLHGGNSPPALDNVAELGDRPTHRFDDLVRARVTVQRNGLGRHFAVAETTVVLEAQKESRP